MPVDPGTPGQGDPPCSQRPGSHIAHFYETREEWLSVMVSWLAEGLHAGDKCAYVMDAGRDWMDAREALIARGVDIRAALESGRLEVREGCRDPRELGTSLEGALAGIPASWKNIRWGGDMVWARDRVASSGTLMSYESGLNAHCDHPIAILCQYDLTRFPGYVIMDALRTHPQTIIDGKLHTTPFHQPAAAFLKALPAREAARDVPW